MMVATSALETVTTFTLVTVEVIVAVPPTAVTVNEMSSYAMEVEVA